MSTGVDERSTGAAPAGPRTVLAASLIGTTVEWYDFFLYATAAGLVFPALFFPAGGDEVIGTLLAFGTFAVGFVARPVGGVIFGHIGDRLGRKRTLVATMVMMGVATALIGLLPSYAAIGVAAPLLLVLLRVLQGIAVGGEWGGAVLLAVENAPPGRRGLYGSVPQIGLGLGLALGTGVFALLGQVLDPETFLSIGWRIAFLISVVLVGVGLVVRLKVLETSEFRELHASGATASVPVVEVFRTRAHRRGVGTGMLARWAEGAAFNTWGVFVITYATATVRMDKTTILLAVTGGALLMAALTPFAGRLADRYGRRRIFGIGAAGFGLTVVPSFLAVQSGIPWLAASAIVAQLGVFYAAMTGTESALFAELFDTGVRYTGMSLVYQGSGIWASGLTPVFLTALLAFGGGDPWWAAGYLVLTAVISLVAVAVMPRYIGWRPEWARTDPW
ncbi:putative MFS family arabinose efflux permease [Pseudonocardia sediminis]|uniref:Putative proline/betaine transporter n=1 Tax=Pseudonocardia sediminis TaxID=1397368 RepID=A0A4Q7V1N7_PSEST|nr:MFS transporter [Pseudonocardia sediminis]RZT87348.1 putative MFS family arabinose efflux permease [Pseudonocardia sediminis]